MTDPSLNPSSPSVEVSSAREKLRARFRKGDDLRFLGHHDLLRCFERMLRRAELPVRQTQGFNPRPKLAFALSLPLGVIGCEEIVDMELEPGTLASLGLDAIHSRLATVAPPGLEILSCHALPPKQKTIVTSMTYRLILPEIPNELPGRIAETLQSEEIWITRRTIKKNHRGEKTSRINVRPFLRDLQIGHDQNGNDAMEMQLWLKNEGTARPSEILELLGLKEQYEAGAILERSRLELLDEQEETISSSSEKQ